MGNFISVIYYGIPDFFVSFQLALKTLQIYEKFRFTHPQSAN